MKNKNSPFDREFLNYRINQFALLAARRRQRLQVHAVFGSATHTKLLILRRLLLLRYHHPLADTNTILLFQVA